MAWRWVVFAAAAGVVTASASPGTAADRTMTNAELNALLAVVSIIKLGGPSSGYVGMLMLKKNAGGVPGAGRGMAFFDDGAVRNINGSWTIKNNRFCRNWAGFDAGAEVCEAWVYLTDNSVKVMVGTNQIGVNAW